MNNLKELKEDLEIAERDLDVITSPEEYKEQDKYITELRKEIALIEVLEWKI